jgi:exodeoxyribonuclease V beta subunit
MTMDHVELDVFACPLDGVSLIEASAGTGKTWNICGLYLRLLLERGLEVSQILVVTFTNAATAELSGRIRERLVAVLAGLEGRLAPGADLFVDRLLATLAGAPAALVPRLKAALHGFDEAAIFTIHGFCQRALADTPFAAGLPFALELVPDDARLRREVVQDFWRREVAGGALHPALARSLAAGQDGPEAWAALLGRAMAKPLARVVWPPAVATAELESRLASLDAAFAAARARWEGAEAVLEAGRPALHKGSYKDGAIAEAAQEWAGWFATGDALAAVDLAKGRLRLFLAGVIASRLTKGQSAPAHPFFDAAQTLAEARLAAEEALALARLALLRRLLETGAEEVRRRKRSARQIAFDDMLYNLYAALTGGRFPQLAATLRQRFPAALIDEFQDTDPLQFAIFRRIYIDAPAAPMASLFLVGDPKQAIYSFRHADLPTYLAAKALAERHYTLNHNQRSTPGLIAAGNALFSANPAVFAQPGLDYLAVSAGAKPRAAFVDESEPAGGAALRVWRLPAPERLTRAEAMARAEGATAAEIARLIAEGRAGRISVGGRPLAAGHMAVLVKSHKQAGRIKRALARLGVGSVELAQASIFHGAEAEELERVLAAVAEPGRTGLLLAALATELLGWDAPALARLVEDEAALLPLLARYAGYRETWLARGFGVLFRQWLEGEGVGPRLLARPDGERRLTNLLHLAELLQRAAAEHPGPEALLRWLADQRRDPAVAEEAQLRLESDRNLVQIVTIHRAKGLEYDIVFCPYLWDGHQRSEGNGDGLDYHDAEGRPVLDFRPEALDDPAIKADRRLERDAEILRQYYVALTRAVHRCYLVAGCYLTNHGRGTSPKQGARSLLNWMAAGGGRGLPEWWEHDLTPEAVEAAWQCLADAAAPHLALLELPDGPGQPLAPDHPDPAHLRALAPPRAIPAGWRIGSFSALAQGIAHEGAAADHDSAIRLPAREPLPEAIPADDVLRFPRGPAAGDCLHAAFEAAEFADPATWDAAIARALAAHPQRLGELPAAEAAPRLAAMLRRGLADVLGTELPDGIRLDRIPPGRRLAELGFHLPVGRLTPAALADCLAAHGLHLPALHFPALAGYLKGYIDLTFQHGERFYMLDWKSNHLGHRPEDYGPAPLAAAMAEHAYGLQALIYSLALHRHLARRLPGYDPARHFGGALYLFVRGVRPGWEVHGAPAGVVFQRPSPALLADLDRLFGHGA